MHLSDRHHNIIVLLRRDRSTLRLRLVPSSYIIVVFLGSFVLLPVEARSSLMRLELLQLGARLPDWRWNIALGR